MRDRLRWVTERASGASGWLRRQAAHTAATNAATTAAVLSKAKPGSPASPQLTGPRPSDARRIGKAAAIRGSSVGWIWSCSRLQQGVVLLEVWSIWRESKRLRHVPQRQLAFALCEEDGGQIVV